MPRLVIMVILHSLMSRHVSRVRWSTKRTGLAALGNVVGYVWPEPAEAAGNFVFSCDIARFAPYQCRNKKYIFSQSYDLGQKYCILPT
jgi:hypothetical protein